MPCVWGGWNGGGVGGSLGVVRMRHALLAPLAPWFAFVWLSLFMACMWFGDWCASAHFWISFWPLDALVMSLDFDVFCPSV